MTDTAPKRQMLLPISAAVQETEVSGSDSLFNISHEGAQRMQAFCLLILTCLTCAAAAYYLKSVLLPFVFAVFLALSLRPIVSLLCRKLHFPRFLSIFVTLLIGAALLVGLAAVVSSSVVELTSNVDAYEQRATSLIDSICASPWLSRMHFTRTDILSTLGTEAADSIGNAIAKTFNALFSLLSNIVIIAIYLMFLMFGAASDDSSPEQNSSLLRGICQSIEYYVLVKAVLSLIVGSITWLILSILGVPMAYVIGLLTFALNFIPNVGPVVAVALPVPLVLLSPSDSGMMMTLILVVVLPSILHLIIGYFIEPKILGGSLELDPVVILLTLMLSGVIWGPVGMLLATPITVACKMVIDQIDWAKPIASLMAGGQKAVAAFGHDKRTNGDSEAAQASSDVPENKAGSPPAEPAKD